MRPITAVAIGLVVVALTDPASAQRPVANRFVTGEIVVKFRPGVNAGGKSDAHRAAGGASLGEIARTRVQRVRVPAGSEAAAIARYQRNPNVLYAEPNFIRTIPTPISHGSSAAVAGDSYFAEQWGFDNSGQPFYCVPWFGGELCLYSGTPDADIDALEAWAISTGSSAVTVAVIDTGVDYSHPDLAPNYDGGYDFVFSDSDAADDHGHGTHVAGTIAAALNNLTGTPAKAEGVAGVAPNARIRAYKVCRADGTCDDFAIQQAIARAIGDGVNVINMSLGGPEYSRSLDDAVQDAWNSGLVIVAGAGNDGTTDRFYPAASDNVISVGAFDEDHRHASFSNYGSWVDIAAPGSTIMSTYPMSACGASTTPGETGCYTWQSGTSMATPHVAGAAALVWSRSDVARNSHVVDILLESADRDGVAAGPPLDTWTIHGGLNLHNALSYQWTKPRADAGDDQSVVDSGRDGTELVGLDGGASVDPDGSILTYAWREGDIPLATGATPTILLSVGVHVLTLEVTAADGDSATDEMLVMVYPSAPVTVTASTPKATEAGPGNGTFTVSRLGDTSQGLTILYAVGGTALGGTDYVSLPGIVTIDAGSSTATIVVTPIDDAMFEDEESVILTLTADEAYSLDSPSEATVAITSDDLPPDLIVTSAAAPSTGGADADVVVTDTTRNQGAGMSPVSQTGFYLSTNTSLDASDVLLGTRPVPVLGPAATDTRSTTLHVPPSTPTGSYYILAKADWDNGVREGVETNNIKASAQIKVGPDFVVSAVTAPASAAAGSAISISDTTKNQGPGSAGASTTRFYLSANTLLDVSDVVLGNRSVPSLAPGTSHAATTAVTVPAGTIAGAYYVIAQADAAMEVPETTETNNTRSSSLLKIGADLIVTATSAPATTTAGGTITVTDTTKNQGEGTAAPSSTGFYLSANTSFGAPDVFLGSRPVDGLSPGASSSAAISLQIPADTAPGSYYVIGRADWNETVAETAEANNNKLSGSLKVGGDLVLTAISVLATASAGGSVSVTETTKNQGAAPLSESATGFYLSANTSFGASDVLLGSRPVGGLSPGASSSAAISLQIPADTPPGSYYVIGLADWNGAVAESMETNNARSSGTIRIGPDLVVTALAAPSSAVAGTSISASDTTKNQGGVTAPPSGTTFYLSSNATFDASDVFLATRSVGSLGVGLSGPGSVALPIPASTAAGGYYIIAKADGANAIAEAAENNNTRARLISITAP